MTNRSYVVCPYASFHFSNASSITRILLNSLSLPLIVAIRCWDAQPRRSGGYCYHEGGGDKGRYHGYQCQCFLYSRRSIPRRTLEASAWIGIQKQNKTMTYNGLPIHEINVNGESFFGGNSTLALENLPAKLVSKIKVYDKRSELEKITKVRKGGENYVLDLQTKREFNGTLITSAGIGIGNNDKKETELISNLFRQKGDNISVIARSGNRYKTSRYPDNRQDNVAMNFVKKFSKRFTLYGNMMYKHYASGNESTLYSEQYLTTGNRYQNSASTSTNRNTMGNGSLGMRWSLDDKTYFKLVGGINLMHI